MKVKDVTLIEETGGGLGQEPLPHLASFRLRDTHSIGTVPPEGRRRAMGRTVRSVQLEPHTLQVAERPRRNVIQAIEPEAERLLLQGGGKVLRDQEGYLYERSSWTVPGLRWSSTGRFRPI